MIIIWGKKVVRARRGIVGDFCPICRQPRRFNLAAVKQVSHVYYIPLGGGELLQYEHTCSGCGLVLALGKSAPVQPRKRRDPADPIELAGSTGVCDPAALVARLEVEERQLTGRATAEERCSLLVEPFTSLAYMFARGERGAPGESLSAVLQLLLLIGLVASIILWVDYAQARTPRHLDLGLSIGFSLCTLILAIVVIKRAPSRGRKLTPLLARALAGLNPPPTEPELAALLERLQSANVPLARKLRAPDLIRQIDAARLGVR